MWKSPWVLGKCAARVLMVQHQGFNLLFCPCKKGATRLTRAEARRVMHAVSSVPHSTSRTGLAARLRARQAWGDMAGGWLVNASCSFDERSCARTNVRLAPMTRPWVRATASRTDFAIFVLQASVSNAVAAALLRGL